MRKRSLWETELIQGDPVQVGNLKLIPVVRVRSIVRRQVTFGTDGSSGGGGGLVWLQPVAMIGHRPDGSETRLAIYDRTWLSIRGMLIGALALPVVYLFFAGLAFLWGRRGKS